MAAAAPGIAVAPGTPDVNALKAQIIAALQHGGAGPAHPTIASNVWDASNVAAALLAGVRDVAATNDKVAGAAKKDLNFVTVSDPSELTKDWFQSVLQIVQAVGPAVIAAVSKDFQPTAQTIGDVARTVPAERLNDKGWLDAVGSLVVQLAPAVVQAIQGTKDFRDPASLPSVTLPQAPAGVDPKAWWNDALNAAVKIAPLAISLLA